MPLKARSHHSGRPVETQTMSRSSRHSRSGINVNDLTRARGRLAQPESDSASDSDRDSDDSFGAEEEWFIDAQDDEELQDMFLDKHLGKARRRAFRFLVSLSSRPHNFLFSQTQHTPT